MPRLSLTAHRFSCCRECPDLCPDERYKADILLVVAHPDDDTLVTSYLARAIFDQHKRVAVVYCTRGDSGPNSEGREQARALGLVREIEGRRAMSVFGISNVWFLDGRDTATPNVLVSLASWPSGSVLEQMVGSFA
jgi:LmbE family N-acetylglucosaminyl deacetylase